MYICTFVCLYVLLIPIRNLFRFACLFIVKQHTHIRMFTCVYVCDFCQFAVSCCFVVGVTLCIGYLLLWRFQLLKANRSPRSLLPAFVLKPNLTYRLMYMYVCMNVCMFVGMDGNMFVCIVLVLVLTSYKVECMNET